MRHRLFFPRLFRAGTAGLLACAWLACLNPRPEEWPSNAAGTDDTSTNTPPDLTDGASGSSANSEGGGGSASGVPALDGGAGTSSESPVDAGAADAAPHADAGPDLELPPSDAGVSSEEQGD
jgi:hypothetical protein